MSKVKTRFAPSPTGYMHVGGVRTALFAWLVARQSKGEFILRIEDTDKTREVSGTEKHIKDSLTWLGLNWDGQYKQSERLDIYKEWALKLVKSGRAYADPYTKAELEKFRQAAAKAKKPFLFREHRPKNPPAWDGSQPLRFKSEPKEYSWHDEVMGTLHTGPEVIDDFILMKPDGYPTYNFCHIVDDHLMGITHVIRSQEFISSVPKFLNLYEALDIKLPTMATLPFVMAIDGHKKLSKRDGAKDILDYAKEGILPEALINFLATLGWNDGSEQEIFSLKELIEKFSLDRVQKAGARFDERRLVWINGHYIRQLSNNDLYKRAGDYWPASAVNASKEYKTKVLELAKDRLKRFCELSSLTMFFFEEPKPNLDLIRNNKPLKKLTANELVKLLETSIKKLQTSAFTTKNLTDTLNELLKNTNQPPNVLFSLIRIATTWTPFSPDLAPSLSILGKKTTIKRLQASTKAISSI